MLMVELIANMRAACLQCVINFTSFSWFWSWFRLLKEKVNVWAICASVWVFEYLWFDTTYVRQVLDKLAIKCTPSHLCW